ncbi:MAG: hypothetical protein LBP80_07120 [Treponema sp.]|nr:hypothetical protein [Treponema sp.]
MKKGTTSSPVTFSRKSYLGFGAVVTGLALLFSCVSGRGAVSPPVSGPVWDLPREGTYSIGNYRGDGSGGEIPRWVNRYLEGGIAGLEAMSEFAETYVFVAENSGTNPNALAQWSLGFSPDQDIAQLIARRVQARFPGSDTGSPDHEYGRYFENLVRAAADTFYEGSERKGDFWFQKEYPAGDGETPEEETYVFWVLLTIDKTALRTQLEPALIKAAEGIEATRDQLSAINHLRASFFDGF